MGGRNNMSREITVTSPGENGGGIQAGWVGEFPKAGLVEGRVT